MAETRISSRSYPLVDTFKIGPVPFNKVISVAVPDSGLDLVLHEKGKMIVIHGPCGPFTLHGGWSLHQEIHRPLFEGYSILKEWLSSILQVV